MSKFTNIFPVFTAIVLAFPSSADTEFAEGIPAEFAEGLVTGPDFGQPTFYSDIVHSFPLIEFPEQFDLLGSVDLIYGTRVIFRSDLSTAEARQILANQLSMSQYAIVPSLSDSAESVGFVQWEVAALPLEFCQDNFGSLAARFRKSATNSIITVDHSSASPSNKTVCSDYIEQKLVQKAEIETRRNVGLRSYQPRMALPQPSSENTMFYGRGVSHSSGDNYFEAVTMLVTEWSIEEIYNHFADQISAQGWELRSKNKVDLRMVGEWTNEPDADFSLLGTFSIHKMSKSEHRLVFRMDRNLYIQNTGPQTPIFIPNNGR